MDNMECSRAILEVMPVVMRAIRDEMRAHRGSGLTVPQFRALLFISRLPGTSLAQLAGHLGLAPATTSKMVDGLVGTGLVRRQESASDRRRITLQLSVAGQNRLEEARLAAQAMLEGRISRLEPNQKKILQEAMQTLRQAFIASGE